MTATLAATPMGASAAPSLAAGAAFVAVLVAARPRRGRGRRLLDASAGAVPAPERGRRGGHVILGVTLVLAAAAVAPPLAAGVAVGLALLPVRRRRRAERRRVHDVVDALPDLIDLLRIAVAGGATAPNAVRIVAPAVPRVVRPALEALDDQVARGARFGDAVSALASTLGPRARPLADALADSSRAGAPLGPALELVAADARRERRHQADLVARRLPVRLCFPLVVCVLPAFVLLTVAPLLAGTIRSLHF